MWSDTRLRWFKLLHTDQCHIIISITTESLNLWQNILKASLNKKQAKTTYKNTFTSSKTFAFVHKTFKAGHECSCVDRESNAINKNSSPKNYSRRCAFRFKGLNLKGLTTLYELFWTVCSRNRVYNKDYWKLVTRIKKIKLCRENNRVQSGLVVVLVPMLLSTGFGCIVLHVICEISYSIW